MAAGKGGLLFSFAFYLVLIRILEDRTSKLSFNEEFYHPDVSTYLIRGSDRPLQFFDAVQLWSTTAFDSHQSGFVPGDSLHYLMRNRKYFYSLNAKAVLMFSLLRSGDVHPHPGPRSGNIDCLKAQSPNNLEQRKKVRQPKYPCKVCSKGVTSRSKAVSCDSCQQWTHIKCSGFITTQKYDSMVSDNSDFSFACCSCTFMDLPFHNEDTDNCWSQTGNTKLPSSADPEHFQCFRRKGLHFLHMNARALLPKMSELKLIASNSTAAMISITETWLDNSVSDAEINIENYTDVRRDRNRNGGGVCVYIRNDFAFSVRSDLQTDNDEILFVELLLPKTKPIIIGTVYRPPKQNEFLNNFEEILTNLRSDCETILLGDFNICILQKSNSIFKEYVNILKLFDLDQIIIEPTRIRILQPASWTIFYVIIKKQFVSPVQFLLE